MSSNRNAVPKASNTTAKRKKRPAGLSFALNVGKIIIIFLVAISCAGAGIVGGAMLGYIKTAQPIRDDDLRVKIETTFVYDDKGIKIDELTGKENKNSEQISIKKIPKFLQKAVISVEDERFETHNGIDFRRITSAVFNFIKSGGNPSHGASTITQQVVKNVTGKTRNTLQRKVQEQYNAILLDKKLEKWEILELYLNIVYFGNSFYGVQSASKAYFGKSVEELDLAECAILAGVTNSPTRYNLFTEKGRINAKKRQEIILELMLKQGKLSQTEHDQAVSEKLTFMDKPETEKGIKIHSYFVDQVINDIVKDLIAEKNVTREEALRVIYNNGLRIYTTQNMDIQNSMDEVFNDPKYFKSSNSVAKLVGEHPEASMVILDPYSGQVKALYGGYGEKTANQTLNRATQIKRQPGSSFKPIAVYGPGIDLGVITPGTIIDDVPVYMRTGADSAKTYPKNYDLLYDGLTSIRNGIKNSVNVVAASVWRDYVTADNSIEYLKKVGIDREKEKYVAISLGALNQGVNTLQMATAYEPFVNKGMFYSSSTYTKVTDSNNKVILEKKPDFYPAYKEESAFIMTDMLTEVVKPRNSTYPHSGTAATYGVLKNSKGAIIPTAGKTGTTSDNIDKWFVGYSPYYVGATWYGYDNKIKPIMIAKDERSNALKIWNAVMLKVHSKLDAKPFNGPTKEIVKKHICIYSGKIASELCTKDPRGNATRDEYFIKGTEPTDEDICKVHVQANVDTQSLDMWNRYLLAAPNCPLSTVVTKVFIQRPNAYIPVDPHDSSLKSWIPGDFKYELPAGEYCQKHPDIIPDIIPDVTTPTPDTSPSPSASVPPDEQPLPTDGLVPDPDVIVVPVDPEDNEGI